MVCFGLPCTPVGMKALWLYNNDTRHFVCSLEISISGGSLAETLPQEE